MVVASHVTRLAALLARSEEGAEGGTLALGGVLGGALVGTVPEVGVLVAVLRGVLEDGVGLRLDEVGVLGAVVLAGDLEEPGARRPMSDEGRDKGFEYTHR